jgi:beta-glucosidase
MTESTIQSLLNDLTLEEKVSLLAGESFWATVPIPRLGIPPLKVSDGPNGVRGGGSLIGKSISSACFPVAISLASSWNTELVAQIGAALAEEARSKSVRVVLGPTTNIHRTPLNGRNFECYSEDPFLSARLVVAYIQGMQNRGVGATVKHFVCNDSEFQRNTISSDLDERPLREIYLPPFEAAVKEAKTWAVMSSYNKVNGTYVSENKTLLRDILKDEWGFDGLVMSDWGGTYSTSEAVNAGLDLEMPGPARWRGEKLLKAAQNGEVSIDAIDDSVRRLLRIIGRTGAQADDVAKPETIDDRPAHRALIRKAAAEGMVLLKNAKNALPLKPDAITSLALIGPNATTAQLMGGGSAQVNAHYRVTPVAGITAQVGQRVELGVEPGCSNYKMLPLFEADGISFHETYFDSPDLSGEATREEQSGDAERMWISAFTASGMANTFSVRRVAQFVPKQSGLHTFSLTSSGLSRLFVDGREVVNNWDKQTRGDSYFGFGSAEVRAEVPLQAGQSYELRMEYGRQATTPLPAARLGYAPPADANAFARAVSLAKSADAAVLFIGTTAEWETEGYDRAGLDLPGEQNALVEQVAAANPNTIVVLQTGGPVTMPWLDKVAAVVQAWLPGQECGNAIADVLFGAVNPSGKLTQTFPQRIQDNPGFINYPGDNGHVRYGEGLFVGYRYYEKKDVPTLFPFGFGLSYTQFAYSNLRLSAEAMRADETLTVSIDVSNTGPRAGQEVVQLYVRDVVASLTRPPKELKGFAKVALEPGETKTVTLSLDKAALSFWDDAKHAWVAEPGEFVALVGASSQHIWAQANFWLRE